eukprot:6594759-Pyramimonas_sp.AAC.1
MAVGHLSCATTAPTAGFRDRIQEWSWRGSRRSARRRGSSWRPSANHLASNPRSFRASRARRRLACRAGARGEPESSASSPISGSTSRLDACSSSPRAAAPHQS